MICVKTENHFGSGRLQVIDFNVQQMLNEWLGDVLIAEHKPEHKRIGNVEFVKGFNDHLYSPITELGVLIYKHEFPKSGFLQILQPTVIRKRHFATYGLLSAETLECMYFNEAA